MQTFSMRNVFGEGDGEEDVIFCYSEQILSIRQTSECVLFS